MSPEGTDGHDPRLPLPRVVTAAPIGVLLVVLALAMAVWTFFRFGSMVDDVHDHDLRELFKALQVIVPSVWVVVIAVGANIVATALDRATLADRLDGQDAELHRIQMAVQQRDAEKEELTQKSRSFWESRSFWGRNRNEPN